MLKRLVLRALLTVCLLTTSKLLSTALSQPASAQPAAAQGADPSQLYYLYQGQRIPLDVRPDAVVVQSSGSGDRGTPFYMQLRQQLQPSGNSRGDGSSNPPGIEINPFGDNSAIVNLSSSAPQTLEQLQTTIQQASPNNAVLPVLTRSDRQETLVLPNVIIVSFAPNLSEPQIQSILSQQNLEVIRPLRFTTNRYLVRSRSATGVAVLTVSNQLNQVSGIESATPNFIQTTANEVEGSRSDSDRPPLSFSGLQPTGANRSLLTLPATLQTSMMPWLWHLFSTPIQVCIAAKTVTQDCFFNPPAAPSTLARTDLRIPEAWQESQQGSGIVVAVIDATIQWDHPNLANNLATVTSPDKYPNEVHGWDFASGSLGDSDTRISPGEISQLREPFQDTFRLSDVSLIQKYSARADDAKQDCQRAGITCSDAKIAELIRSIIRSNTTSNFHGTSVASVVASRPFQAQGQAIGVVGVAPNAKLLPVRVGGVSSDGPKLDGGAIVEAIGYAADRGADVINLSLGGASPSQERDSVIAEVLAQYPRLMIVASSGNCGNPNSAGPECGRVVTPDQVVFPAANPGVVAVGAIDVQGNRASFSSYGKGLTLVAPGQKILTTGGTFINDFWAAIGLQDKKWGTTLDSRGQWLWEDGTSFSSPAVAGVVALMMAEDPQQRLNRDQLVKILKDTAQTTSLRISPPDQQRYNNAVKTEKIPASLTAQQYFFGAGLVNAEAAVKNVQNSVQ